MKLEGIGVSLGRRLHCYITDTKPLQKLQTNYEIAEYWINLETKKLWVNNWLDGWILSLYPYSEVPVLAKLRRICGYDNT